MSRDLGRTALSVQAEQLKKSLENRDKRRKRDQATRAFEKDDDGWESQRAPKHAHVGQTQPSAISALAAISAEDTERTVYTCELCNANFLSSAQYQVHLGSTVHMKALEKQEAERVRQERLQQAGLFDMAAMALGAAAWAGTHASSGGGTRGGQPGRAGGHNHHGNNGGGGGNAGRGGRRGGQGPPVAAQRGGRTDVRTHEQVLSSMRKPSGEEDLEIDGWVPPSITAPAPQPSVVVVAAAHEAQHKSEAGGPDPSQLCAQEIGGSKGGAGQAHGGQGEGSVGGGENKAEEQGKEEGAGGGVTGLGLGYGSDSEDESDSDGSDGPPMTSFF